MSDASRTKSVYVMPWNTQVLYVYYRPSMFKKVGISVPKTYAEFLEACRKLTQDTNGDGKTDVYGFGMRGAKGGQEPWGSFIWARGGNFNDMTTTRQPPAEAGSAAKKAAAGGTSIRPPPRLGLVKGAVRRTL